MSKINKTDIMQGAIAASVAVVIQLLAIKVIYLALAFGVLLAVFCIIKARFSLFPALVILYARSSTVCLGILILVFIRILYESGNGRMRQVLKFPDVLIFPLLIWIVSMLVPACLRSGGSYLEVHYHELWSTLGLFGFYFGMAMYHSFSKKTCLLLFGSAIFVLFYEVLLKRIDEETIVVRTIFLWGPFFCALFSLGLKHINPLYVVMGITGILAFIITMLVGLPTLTLQGSAVYASGLAIMGGSRNFIARALLRCSASWVAFLMVILSLIYGVSTLEENSVARDRGTMNVSGEYKFVSIDRESVDRFRAKFFDDRAAIWRACWADITTAPYYWRPSDERQIRFFEDSLGRTVDDFSIGAHNVFLGILLRMRWCAGSMFLILYCTMIMRGAKVLFIHETGSDSLWCVMGATVVAVGVFGSLTGDFPVMYSFNFPFMSLAGLCYARFLEFKRKPLHSQSLRTTIIERP